MVMKIVAEIEENWKEGDPDGILGLIYRAMNEEEISTAYVKPLENSLQIIRMADPYDFSNSITQFDRTVEIVWEKLGEAGYTVKYEKPDKKGRTGRKSFMAWLRQKE